MKWVKNWLDMWGRDTPPEDFEDFLYWWGQKHGHEAPLSMQGLRENYNLILRAFESMTVGVE